MELRIISFTDAFYTRDIIRGDIGTGGFCPGGGGGGCPGGIFSGGDIVQGDIVLEPLNMTEKVTIMETKNSRGFQNI